VAAPLLLVFEHLRSFQIVILSREDNEGSLIVPALLHSEVARDV
jgi:hypothetical protein